ncbi:unnamed protein product, partial [Brassica rapa]
DAALSKESGTAGLRWIIYQHLPDSIVRETKCVLSVLSPLMAEALAMCEAIMSAKLRLLSKVWFRSNSQELVQDINSKSNPVEFYEVLTDIEFLSMFFKFTIFLSFLELRTL